MRSVVFLAPFASFDGEFRGIEIGRLGAPQMGLADRDAVETERVFRTAPERHGFGGLTHDGSLSVPEHGFDPDRPGCVAAVDHVAAEYDRRTGRVDRGRLDEDAFRSAVLQVEMDGIDGDQLHIAVNASVEGEIGVQGRNVPVVLVIQPDFDDVLLPEFEVTGDVEVECRVAARVTAGRGAVDEYLGDLVGPFEMEDDPAVLPLPVGDEGVGIPSHAAVVARGLVECVVPVPGVGQVHPGPCAGGRGPPSPGRSRLGGNTSRR